MRGMVVVYKSNTKGVYSSLFTGGTPNRAGRRISNLMDACVYSQFYFKLPPL